MNTISAHEIPEDMATTPPMSSPIVKTKTKNTGLFYGSVISKSTCRKVAIIIENTAIGDLLQ